MVGIGRPPLVRGVVGPPCDLGVDFGDGSRLLTGLEGGRFDRFGVSSFADSETDLLRVVRV